MEFINKPLFISSNIREHGYLFVNVNAFPFFKIYLILFLVIHWKKHAMITITWLYYGGRVGGATLWDEKLYICIRDSRLGRDRIALFDIGFRTF